MVGIYASVVACGTTEADVRAPEVDEPEDETEGHQGHQQPQDHQHPLQEFCSKIRTLGSKLDLLPNLDAFESELNPFQTDCHARVIWKFPLPPQCLKGQRHDFRIG